MACALSVLASRSSQFFSLMMKVQAGAYVVEELASDSGHIVDAAPQTAYISGKQQDVV